MNLERFNLLIEAMKKVAATDPTKYNQNKWVDYTSVLDNDLVVTINGKDYMKEGACGSAACIVGTACSMPEIYKQGLRLRRENGYFVPEYKDEESFDAVATFFEIPLIHVYAMFGEEYTNEVDRFYHDDRLNEPNYDIDFVVSRLEAYRDGELYDTMLDIEEEYSQHY